MATIPHAKLVCASSPYSRKGALWTAYKRYFGQPDPNVLIWQAPTRVMNPTVSQGWIDKQFELDPASAEAEYNAQFRSDIEAFIDRAVIEGLVMSGRHELAPSKSFSYFGFADPSGGGQDSYTFAVAHLEGEVIVLDCLREIKPPFSPRDATAELAALARSYGLSEVSGDKYAGQWPAEQWRAAGVSYRFSERSKSELYGELLPLLNAGKIELLDHPKLVNQLAGLERRTTRGSGRDVVDHPVGPAYHDDVANVLAGVASVVTRRPNLLRVGTHVGDYTGLTYPGWRNGRQQPPGPCFMPVPRPRPRLVLI